jgi:hypothetical protein
VSYLIKKKKKKHFKLTSLLWKTPIQVYIKQWPVGISRSHCIYIRTSRQYGPWPNIVSELSPERNPRPGSIPHQLPYSSTSFRVAVSSGRGHFTQDWRSGANAGSGAFRVMTQRPKDQSFSRDDPPEPEWRLKPWYFHAVGLIRVGRFSVRDVWKGLAIGDWGLALQELYCIEYTIVLLLGFLIHRICFSYGVPVYYNEAFHLLLPSVFHPHPSISPSFCGPVPTGSNSA